MGLRDVCRLGVLLSAAALAVWTASAAAGEENWPRFRGENGTGISGQKGLPVTWSPGDYAWNIELPGVGHAAPVVWGDHLFVTSADDDGALRFLFCIDARTGERKWSRMVGMNRSPKHLKSSWASSTPATDGERVYVAFADKETYSLSAYDFDGELVWRRKLGPFASQHGQGVSPIVYEDMVILPNDQDGPSSIMAFDRCTGQTRWSVLRPLRDQSTSYSTPIVLELEDRKPQLICISGAAGVTSHDPLTGDLNWNTAPFPLRTVASPVYGGGVVLASCGQGGKMGVLMIAVDPTGKGDVSQTHVRYKRDRDLAYVPTPVVSGRYAFLWQDTGIVNCVEIATGKTLWTRRIGGNYSGSPICIDGKLYCISEDGEVVVIEAGPEFKLLGKTSLGDFSHSTPAVAGGRLLLRTFHRLVALEAQE